MSRLVALLEERAAPGAPPLTVANLRALLDDLVVRLDAPGGRIELAFPFFVRKIAPVSGVASLLDYEVRLAGELDGGRYAQTITVAVPVTSLCPCSKEISDYGAHNQRSTITITVRPRAAGLRRRAAAHRRGRGVVRALRHPQARRREIRHRARVRQSALRRGPGARRRGAAGRRSALRRLRVEAENFESIHNHSAYARIARGSVARPPRVAPAAFVRRPSPLVRPAPSRRGRDYNARARHAPANSRLHR